jgi:hypothetical protein
LPKLGSFQSPSRAASATCRASLSVISVAMCPDRYPEWPARAQVGTVRVVRQGEGEMG